MADFDPETLKDYTKVQAWTSSRNELHPFYKRVSQKDVKAFLAASPSLLTKSPNLKRKLNTKRLKEIPVTDLLEISEQTPAFDYLERVISSSKISQKLTCWVRTSSFSKTEASHVFYVFMNYLIEKKKYHAVSFMAKHLNLQWAPRGLDPPPLFAANLGRLECIALMYAHGNLGISLEDRV